MAKLSKKAVSEFDEAVDHLGGGAPPVPLPKRSRRVARPRKAAKAKKRTKKR